MFVKPRDGIGAHVAALDGRAWRIPPEGRELPDDPEAMRACGLERCVVIPMKAEEQPEGRTSRRKAASQDE